MGLTTVTRTINAPVDVVFRTISDINNFSKAVPEIVKVEFLSDTKSGVGTRFRETRNFKGREATTELEVTEYRENDHIRILSDAGGTIWDTVFTVKAQGDQTNLDMTMDAKAYKLFAKLMNPLMKGMLTKALESDMDSVKSYCEENG